MDDEELVRLFWGKAGRDRRRVDLLHPALFHMIDVGMVARAMVMQSPRSALRRLSLAGRVGDSAAESTEVLARRIGLLVALHDLGKISPGFQKKRDDLISPAHTHGLLFPATLEADHGRVTLSHLGHKTLPRSPAQLLARALAAHHGSFQAPDQLFRQREQDGTGLWWEMRDAAIQTLAEVFDVDADVTGGLQSFTPADTMVLAGLTAVADWIGSSSDRDRDARDNQGFFPRVGPVPPPLKVYADRAWEQACRALKAIGWDPWQPDRENWTFAQMFPPPYIDKPNDLQKQAEALTALIDGPCLIIIEAPMGFGKTEAGLYLADVLLNRCGHVGLYDALPTQATSNQMYRRVKDSYLRQRLLGNPANLHLLHGLASFDDAYAELLEAEALYEFDVSDEEAAAIPTPTGIDGLDETPNGQAGAPEARSLRAASWFRGRKLGLLSPFAVGTIDQALMGALQVRHMFVRLYGLADKVVLIDEAHAYDLYMTQVMKVLLQWLGAMHSSVILMSATLPSIKRRELAEAYAGGKVELEAKPYPRITWLPHDRRARGVVRHIKKVPEKDVIVCRLDVPVGATPHSTVADRLRVELEGGGCAAWICNTVASAQLAWLELDRRKRAGDPVFAACEIVLCHARFTVARRRAIEGEVDRLFGKEGQGSGNRPGYAVLIGTQVLEQALDYDVDLMVTELAPVDLVMQRSGRMHRHADNIRPQRLLSPRLMWVAPSTNDQEEPQFGDDVWIYEPAVLLKSMLVLQATNQVRLPRGIEDLVEQVYGEGEIAFPPELRDLATRLEQRAAVNYREQELLAGSNSILSPDDPEDPFRMDLLLPDDEAATDRHGRPGTRLAEPSVSVVCAVDRDGDTVLADGLAVLDSIPNREEERRLLGDSLRIQSRQWVHDLLHQPVPTAWRDSAVLREHRLLRFRPDGWEVGGRQIMLHGQLGLVLKREVLDEIPR